MSAPGSAPVPQELPPQAALLHLTTGHWIMHGIYAAAQLEIADLLQDGPRTLDELARSAVVHPRSLHRLLRALASVGIFAEQEDGRFALTPMAECLRSHVPGSMRAWALLVGQPWDSAAWAGLVDSVKTGRTAFDKVHGLGLFEYLAQHPDDERLFGQAMTSPSSNQIPSVLAAYDFSGIDTLVDVAGGHGVVLEAILTAYPAMKGVVADLPGVLEGTRRRFQASGLSDRCDTVPVNFFESVPDGGDAYLMKHIIHDWDDERATKILQNCHRAMGGRGKLLLIEMVIPPGNGPDFGKWLDIGMLVLTGGLERTADEYRDLLASAGFRLTQIVPTQSPVSVIEAIPV